jgi:hypothetical protein
MVTGFVTPCRESGEMGLPRSKSHDMASNYRVNHLRQSRRWLTADHKHLRDEHHHALTEIINTQNETALKLAICIDRNTAALQEVSTEIRYCRERQRP